MLQRHLGLVTGIVVSSLTATMAHAQATTIFNNESAFLSQVQAGSYLETFNSLPQYTLLPSPLSFSSGDFSYTASAVDDFYSIGPVGDTWLSTNFGGEPIVFDFTGGNVTAAGGFFFLTDLSGNLATGTVTVNLSDGTSQSISNPEIDSFLGFITNSSITSLIVTPSTGSFSTVNDFTIGAATTPESSLIFPLLGLGLVGLGLRLKEK